MTWLRRAQLLAAALVVFAVFLVPLTDWIGSDWIDGFTVVLS